MKVSTPEWLAIQAMRGDYDARVNGGRQTQIIEWTPT